MIADAQYYDTRDGGAASLPTLRRAIARSKHLPVRQKLRGRYIDLAVRLWKEHPNRYDLNDAIDVATDHVKDDDMDVDGWISLAELYLMDRNFATAIRLLGRDPRELQSPQHPRPARPLRSLSRRRPVGPGRGGLRPVCLLQPQRSLPALLPGPL